MLKELWQYWTTPVRHPAARKMGYLYESIALAARYQRCKTQWQPHYAQCREAVWAAAQAMPAGGRVLVLGAGLLEDLPLDALSERFGEIVLVDLVWLRQSRRRARRYENVRIVEHDVTESLEALLAGELSVSLPRWGLAERFDLVVSMNLITQLPLLPARWMMKQGIADRQIDAFGQALIRAHLEYLKGFDGAQVCLVADRRIMERDRTGRQTDGIDPWWGVTPPVPQRSWWWEAVPQREGGGFSRRHQVGVSYWRNGGDGHATG